MSSTEQHILDLELDLEEYFNSGKATLDEIKEWNSEAFAQQVWDNIQRGRFRPDTFLETVSRPVSRLRDTVQH
jgi:hypothetical protein